MKSSHLLLQGFKKAASQRAVHVDEHRDLALPGIIQVYPNYRVTAMKASPWPQILNLLGKEGERIMIDLILDCGIFAAIDGGKGNYHQLSGMSISVGRSSN